ncbi:hypothetical protein U0038_17545 [Sphingobacterium spiritivorum]|uniref:Uncharacterized protein n=1 Tax=Sphingobacterium spiritivorum ATCC 33861 TaxID=525373 RepID=D7VN51_SPHSI|nr:hypothetical protein [Sphingobacterium spiritivorum]EFK57348.1 hypothetical protein HMPREF0766_12421 [Sphingobacterium spiritivorum ATCC 33861]QQT36572.1 hypothetical protein I6J01_03835 [Sphingobacterium spiritivorum]WQD33323.1 hypothetical protein U0038_17545 [Sphingobacterium spiritivorum]SUJ22085.1 Uncharacterised protein [Sphingobacterium spiritivorum]
MKKPIIIPVTLSNGENVKIPLLYTITNDDNNPNIRFIDCQVDLPDEEIPEWLSPTTFTIRQVCLPGEAGGLGVTNTEVSHIRCKNTDTAKFIGNTFLGIKGIEGLV